MVASTPRKEGAELVQQIDSLFFSFEPETNLMDRRIYFEVTGNQLIEDEFADDQSDGDWVKKHLEDQAERPLYTHFIEDEKRISLITGNKKRDKG